MKQFKTFLFLLPLLVFGIAKGNKDKCSFKTPRCSPDITWENKYQLDSTNNLIPYTPVWYYFGIEKFEPEYKERFPLSSTLFVGFTDPWHKWDMVGRWMVMLTCLTLIMTGSPSILKVYPGVPLKRSIKAYTWKLALGVAMCWLTIETGFHLIYTIL